MSSAKWQPEEHGPYLAVGSGAVLGRLLSRGVANIPTGWKQRVRKCPAGRAQFILLANVGDRFGLSVANDSRAGGNGKDDNECPQIYRV